MPTVPHRLAAPEGAGLAALYRDHHRRVQARARRVTRDVTAAQDVAQDVFVAYAAYAQAHPVRNPRALLGQMAEQVALKQRRRGAREAGPPRSEPAAPPRLAAEDALALRAVLAVLAPREVQMAVQHYVDGMDHDEIARQLGIGRREVGRALAHFCARARRLLGDLGP